jgi:hypothetical protein
MNTKLVPACLVALVCVLPGRAEAAGPGDVYYSVHVVQKFQYYVFADDVVEWTNATYAGTSLNETAQHDSSTVLGTVGVFTSLQADSSVFTGDINSDITVAARTGIFYQTYNDITVDVYIRAPSGTLYDITLDTTGLLEASREGGLDGSLQDVNGISTAAFEDSMLTVANGGTESLALASFQTFSGTTTTEIVVNNEVYSLARTFVLTSMTSVTQALCILGCMREAAEFHAAVTSHVILTVYPYGIPSAIHNPQTPQAIALSAAPNPWRGSTRIAFQAEQGAATKIDVFDVHGRHVAKLFDAPATGRMQSFRWDASNLSSGIYFLRAQGAGASSTRKLVLLK